jgi:hypothetical protein
MLCGSRKPESWRLLAQVLGITQRVICVKYDHCNQKFSRRKMFPTNPKTVGDHLLVKRYIADISQAEAAALVGVPIKKLRAWECDQTIPTKAELNSINAILVWI